MNVESLRGSKVFGWNFLWLERFFSWGKLSGAIIVQPRKFVVGEIFTPRSFGVKEVFSWRSFCRLGYFYAEKFSAGEVCEKWMLKSS